MIGGIALSGLASAVVLGFMLQTGTPPRDEDPHADPKPVTATGTCEDLPEYVETLFTTIEEHETFADFWIAPDYDGIQQMDQDDIEALVDDGTTLLADLEAMDVPAPYGPGHEGILLIFDSDVDYVTFLGLDASTVPDLGQWERGMALLLQGELTIANACPDELGQVGNFVFYDPEMIETVFD